MDKLSDFASELENTDVTSIAFSPLAVIGALFAVVALAGALFPHGHGTEENAPKKEQSNKKQASRPKSKKGAGADGKESKKSASAAGQGSDPPGEEGSSSSEDLGALIAEMEDKLKFESPCIRGASKSKYIKSKCGKYWYSRDNIRHGGAAFKCYKDTKSKMIFLYSVDENLKPITSKHESKHDTHINKSDTWIVSGEDK